MDEETKKEEPSIREWYEAKTRRAVRWLVGFGAVSLLIGIVLFAVLPDAVTLKLQVFNGAYTIPIGALIWIVIFTLIWMMPIREISFRTFESTEALRNELRACIKDDVKPGSDRLTKLADRLEGQFTDEFFERVNKALDSVAFSGDPLPMPPEDIFASRPINGDPEDPGARENLEAEAGELTPPRTGGEVPK